MHLIHLVLHGPDSPDRNLATNLATAFSRVTWTRCAKRVRELAVPVPDVRKMLPVAVQTEARNNHIRGATRPKVKHDSTGYILRSWLGAHERQNWEVTLF